MYTKNRTKKQYTSLAQKIQAQATRKIKTNTQYDKYGKFR